MVGDESSRREGTGLIPGDVVGILGQASGEKESGSSAKLVENGSGVGSEIDIAVIKGKEN